MPRMHAEELSVDADLVRHLLRTQFPSLAALSLAPVDSWGTDHAIWRLGEELVLRFPRIGWAAAQPEHEARVLRRLAPALPVAVPEPIVLGRPDHRFPFPWAVHRWLPGESAELQEMRTPERFARDLAGVLRALAEVDPRGAPPAAGRAQRLRDYETSARTAISSAAPLIDVGAAVEVWQEAVDARPHSGAPRWVHGDLEGNCLIRDGRLSGIIDWGSACAGDPAVDIQVVWSPLFTPATRAEFLRILDVDEATVLRSRGAAVQQACAALPYYLGTYPEIVARSRHKLRALGIALREEPPDGARPRPG